MVYLIRTPLQGQHRPNSCPGGPTPARPATPAAQPAPIPLHLEHPPVLQPPAGRREAMANPQPTARAAQLRGAPRPAFDDLRGLQQRAGQRRVRVSDERHDRLQPSRTGRHSRRAHPARPAAHRPRPGTDLCPLLCPGNGAHIHQLHGEVQRNPGLHLLLPQVRLELHKLRLFTIIPWTKSGLFSSNIRYLVVFLKLYTLWFI
ncbi:hypothetical protein B484DRAFT_144302 [Ochromonadaceae sp. CCMP2298]|nr:hypothetical protein B484DRAFT_144302 [Ochromonadaceae sp. CCMP2298]